MIFLYFTWVVSWLHSIELYCLRASETRLYKYLSHIRSCGPWGVCCVRLMLTTSRRDGWHVMTQHDKWLVVQPTNIMFKPNLPQVWNNMFSTHNHVWLLGITRCDRWDFFPCISDKVISFVSLRWMELIMLLILIGHLDSSGGWISLDVRTETKKTCGQDILNYVLKICSLF